MSTPKLYGFIQREGSPHEMLVGETVYDCMGDAIGWIVTPDCRDACHADETDTWECVCDGIGRYGKRITVHVMECSACGRTYEHVSGGYEYCPRCGARITEVDDG